MECTQEALASHTTLTYFDELQPSIAGNIDVLLLQRIDYIRAILDMRYNFYTLQTD